MTKPIVIAEDWGITDYKEAWDRQTLVHKTLVEKKREERDLPDSEKTPPDHRLIMTEHPHVYTLGKSGKEDHLLVNESSLQQKNATFYKINRGGDITYHGPGQLVVYPILDLDYFFHDVHRYVRSLEEVIIRLLDSYGIAGTREKDYTGVWVTDKNQTKQKICAIGVHLSRWVSLHGLAFNVDTDLDYFENIIPCGIQESDRTVTSLSKLLGEKISLDKIKPKLMQEFAEVFDCEVRG